MVRPSIGMVIDDTFNGQPEVVQLAAPSADAAVRLMRMQEMKKKQQEADAKAMPPPSLPGVGETRSKTEKRKDNKLINKIVKPKGWNDSWSKKSEMDQAYEIHYTEEDIKFGFPTYEEKQNSITSAEAIWNDELFDTEKYQDWEDEWAEYDLKKGSLSKFVFIFFLFQTKQHILMNLLPKKALCTTNEILAKKECLGSPLLE